jgi:hypothetical protein
MDCSRCIFAITTPPASGGPFGSWQCGCRVDRLETLKQRGEAHLPEPMLEGEMSNFYKLDRFCNMYRTSKWTRDKRIKNAEESAREESACSFGIVVDVSSQNEDEINSTVRSIGKICYKKEKMIVVLSSDYEENRMQMLVNETHKLLGDGIDCQLVVHSKSDPTDVLDQQRKDKDAFVRPMKNRQNFLLKVRGGQTLDKDFFNFIDREVNELLVKSVFFEDPKNGISALAFGAVNAAYLEFLDYDLMSKELKNLSVNQSSYRKYEKKN